MGTASGKSFLAANFLKAVETDRRNMSETVRRVIVAGRSFALRASQVERSMRAVLPEPLKDHYVVIGQRRYPPKQVLGQITGLDRAEFTSHHARRILSGLGFAAGRRSSELAGRSHSGSKSRRRTAIHPRPAPDTLEPFVGQWVATKGAEVIVAAPEPRTVVSWLSEHGLKADSMFRVPADEFEASGLAPR
jgi:hypothetical protein